MCANIKVKCRFCKKEIDRDTAYKVGKASYYCSEEHYKAQLNKNEYKPNKKTSDGEINNRRLLTDYIQKIYVDNGVDKHDINFPLICKQIQNIQKNNPKITDNWIRYILQYMIEVKEINLFNDKYIYDGSILNLVEYYYIEARNYCMKTREIKESINNFDFNNKLKIIHKNNNFNILKHKGVKFDED